MIGFFLGVGIILGLFLAPFMTASCLMYHYGHDTLGLILLIIGILRVVFAWVLKD